MDIPPRVFPAVAAANELITSKPEYISNESTASELKGNMEPERKPAMKSPDKPY